MLGEGENDGWLKVTDLQGIAIWKKEDGSPTGILKGVCIVERAKPYEVIAVILAIDIRSHCNFAHLNVILKQTPAHKLYLNL
jgi:hypothetical protein